MRVKLLAISDTHLAGVDEPFSAIVESLGQTADLIVHAGDYTSPEVVGRVLFVNPGSPFSPRHRGKGTVAVIKVDRELSAQIVEVNGCM